MGNANLWFQIGSDPASAFRTRNETERLRNSPRLTSRPQTEVSVCGLGLEELHWLQKLLWHDYRPRAWTDIDRVNIPSTRVHWLRGARLATMDRDESMDKLRAQLQRQVLTSLRSGKGRGNAHLHEFRSRVMLASHECHTRPLHKDQLFLRFQCAGRPFSASEFCSSCGPTGLSSTVKLKVVIQCSMKQRMNILGAGTDDFGDGYFCANLEVASGSRRHLPIPWYSSPLIFRAQNIFT